MHRSVVGADQTLAVDSCWTVVDVAGVTKIAADYDFGFDAVTKTAVGYDCATNCHHPGVALPTAKIDAAAIAETNLRHPVYSIAADALPSAAVSVDTNPVLPVA